MHLAFQFRELRELCLNEAAAVERYGADMAAHLRSLLADMIAADTLAELVTGNLRADPRDSDLFLMDLGAFGRVSFRPNHIRKNDDVMKPERVSRVMVISVEINNA